LGVLHFILRQLHTVPVKSQDKLIKTTWPCHLWLARAGLALKIAWNQNEETSAATKSVGLTIIAEQKLILFRHRHIDQPFARITDTPLLHPPHGSPNTKCMWGHISYTHGRFDWETGEEPECSSALSETFCM
jgi:hypothetical protein